MKGGKYLKKMREDHNLNQVELGKIIGKRSERICEWERDKHAIKLVDFLEIAEKLNIKDYNELFNC
tara:strand:+ start:6419 stop:6616 length:198 start_codon:yes stop_codon:yes gene_type:complete